MSFVGEYKIFEMVLRMDEKKGLVLGTPQEALENCKSEDDRISMQKNIDTVIIITEDNKAQYAYPIPEGTSQEDIDSAIADGCVIVDGKLVVEEIECKVEDGALYLWDESAFMTGSQWAKISTDDPEVLDLISMKYKKVR